MANRIDEHRCRLMNKILFANSQEEVIQSIDDALKYPGAEQVSEDFINGFAERLLDDLKLFSPINKDAQQWSNIRMAIVYLKRIKVGIKETID